MNAQAAGVDVGSANALRCVVAGGQQEMAVVLTVDVAGTALAGVVELGALVDEVRRVEAVSLVA